jgi:uncharacterized protein YkwD
MVLPFAPQESPPRPAPVRRHPTPTNTSRRNLAPLPALALLAFLVALLVPGTAGAADGRASDYVSRINSLRGSVGATSLQVDGELTAAAQACAQRMAATNTLSHSPDITSGITQQWLKVGENVGVGPDNPTIFAAFVASPHHYENLVDPDFNRVGVGVADGGGRQWTCHRFMQIGGAVAPTGGSAPASGSNASSAKHASTGSAPSNGATVPAAGAPSSAAAPAGPPPPQPGPPPPADSARVAAVLTALRHLAV